MNHQVRDYLIEVAKHRSKTVTYSEIVRDCNLGFDLSTDHGKGQLGKLLGDDTEFEFKSNRPLITSMVI